MSTTRRSARTPRALLATLLIGATILLGQQLAAGDEVTPPTDGLAADSAPTTVTPPPTEATLPPETTVSVEPAPEPEAVAPAPPPALAPEPTQSIPAATVEVVPSESASVTPAGSEVVIPIKTSQAGTSAEAYADEEKCADIDLEAGQVLWHLVFGPIDQDIANPTASLDWPGVGTGIAPDALQGANFDWTVINTETTVPATVQATTNAPKFNPRGPIQTELRVSHTCVGGGSGGEETGSLRIVKVESGPNAPASPGTYTISYDGPGSADGEVEVTAGTPVTVNDLPVGSYTIDEVDPPDDALVSISPNPVSVPSDDTVTVTVRNTFPSADEEPETGSLSFVKVETGATAPSPPGTYTIAYDGPGSADGEVEVTAGDPAVVVDDLPVGSYVISEVDPPEQATPSITPNPAVVGADETVEVTVVNDYPGVEDTVIHQPGSTPGDVGTPDGDQSSQIVSATPGNASGTLPRTGAGQVTALVVLAGLLLAAGGLALAGRRYLTSA